MKNTKNSKGITLIVLIITIIIMLILVAVVIDITKDRKLIDNAQEAVEKTNTKVGQIQNRVDELMGELNNATNEPIEEFKITETTKTEIIQREGHTYEFEGGEPVSVTVNGETSTEYVDIELTDWYTENCGWVFFLRVYASGKVEYIDEYIAMAYENEWDEMILPINLTFTSGTGATDSTTFDFVWYQHQCLLADTLITVVDYEDEDYEDENGNKKRRKVRRIIKKRIDELKVGDIVLAYNPETGELAEDTIKSNDVGENKYKDSYDVWTFSDGTIIKTVNKHRFYNIEKQAYVYMNEWKIGEHAYNEKGEKVALISHEEVKELVQHYTLFTKKYNNYFANGLLSGNRYSTETKIV